MLSTTILQYPGSKLQVIKALWSLIPAHERRITSPFCGGMAFEIYLASRGYDVQASDAFEPLIQFWQQAAADPRPVASFAKKWVGLSRDEFRAMWDSYYDFTDPVKRAGMFFVLNRASYGGVTLARSHPYSGKGLTKKSVRNLSTFIMPPRLSVAHSDYKDAIARTDDFLYLDPPYPLIGNNTNLLYGHLGSTHKDFDHEELAAILKTRGRWIMSNTDSDYIRSLYADFEIQSLKWAYGIRGSRESNEIVILNLGG